MQIQLEQEGLEAMAGEMQISGRKPTRSSWVVLEQHQLLTMQETLSLPVRAVLLVQGLVKRPRMEAPDIRWRSEGESTRD